MILTKIFKLIKYLFKRNPDIELSKNNYNRILSRYKKND